MVAITVTETGLDTLVPSLERLSNLVSSASMLEEAANYMLRVTKERYLNTTDPDGREWPESFAAKRRKQQGRQVGPYGKTLYDTGTLYNSISLSKVSNFEYRIGTSVSYALEHNLGLGIVQRKFLGFGDEDIQHIDEIVARRIQEAING